MCVATSRDGGKAWSKPLPISGKGGDCWKNPGEGGVDPASLSGGRDAGPPTQDVIYRSPWPILLRDGRIFVVFARRFMPGGIGGIVSADGGETWSKEFVIRDDAKWWDLGYPVGCEFEDGRIFVAYYFNVQDGNGQGGTRHIAASTFRLASR